LKQASKQLHEKFDNVILLNEFKINKVDKHIYVKNTDKSYCMYLYWWMLILGNNKYVIKFLKKKKKLTNMFDMKDFDIVDVY
jgi:hypothetical protein